MATAHAFEEELTLQRSSRRDQCTDQNRSGFFVGFCRSPLNPNQPNHFSAAPSMTKGMLCGH